MKVERIVTWVVIVAMFGYFHWKLGADGQLEPGADTDVGGHFELAHPMGQMQKFMDKLHFAGREQNWELAGFYLHELEEQAEEIVESGVHEDGVDVSQLTQQLLVSQIEELEEHVQMEDSAKFESGYLELVDRCNACHQTSSHGFIQIKVPELSMFKNQEYRKLD